MTSGAPPPGDRGGVTYDHSLDYDRLNCQAADVWRVMMDGGWHTLDQLHTATSHPEASISARLRDFRKEKFGSHRVERERLTGGLFRYRLVPNTEGNAMATGWEWRDHDDKREGKVGRRGWLEMQFDRSGENPRYMKGLIWLTGQRKKTDRYMRDENGNEHWRNTAAVVHYAETTSNEDIWSRGVPAVLQRPPPEDPTKPPRFRFIDDVTPNERKKTKRSNGNGHRYPQRGCEVCPLKDEWPRLKHPQIPLRGTPDADILILGEAPGREEDQQGRPFVGPAGRQLQALLPREQENRIAMTNILRCHPLGNRDPEAQEIHACSVYLENDIAKGRFKAILGLGAAALNHFLPGASISHLHGLKFPVEIAGKLLWFYPTYHPAYILHHESGAEQSPALPIIANDIKRFFAEVDDWPAPAIECPDPAAVVCAQTEAEAKYWINQLAVEQSLGLDIETNGLRPTAKGALIMTAAVSDGTMAVAWPIKHQENANNWGLPLLLSVARDQRWVAHNAGFELAWLQEHAKIAGIDWEPQAGFDDSMAAARLHHYRDTGLSLGMLTRFYCGVDIKTLSQINTKNIANEPLAEVLRYNGIDAWGCWRIFAELGPQVDPGNYRALLDSTASVVAMQLTGLDIDRAAVHQLREEWEGRVEAAVAQARALPEVTRYINERHRDFNLGSGDHVGEVLVDYAKIPLPRTGKGYAYKTDDATLTALAPEHPLALAALEYRHARKINETYVEPLISAPTHSEDRRIHPAFSTLLTRTYRLSAEDPPIQQWPKRKNHEVRRPVVPPPGCLWASADFGQLEARVFAMASRDRALIKSTIEREDIHGYWLDRILQAYPPYIERLIHKTGSDNRKAWRDSVKGDLVFASFYGSTAKNVAERTGIPYDIAMDLLGDFWDRYSGAADWLKKQRQQYRDHGFARDLLGRVRYGVMSGNECINTPIQGTAARLVLDGQNELYQLSKEDKDPYLLPRLNIHDDLIFALPDDPAVIEAYIEVISEVLVKVRYDFQIVPLMVEWKVGDNWADLDPVHEHIGDYVK